MRAALLIALLALSGCAPHVRYISTPCLNSEQVQKLRDAEPPRVHEKLTGRADEDLRTVSGSALRLRSWGEGLLDVIEGCAG